MAVEPLPTCLDGAFNQIQVARRRLSTDGFVAAYVFQSATTISDEVLSLEVGRDLGSNLSQSLQRSAWQVDRWRRVRTDSTLSPTNAASPILRLEFFLYLAACACLVACCLLGAPGR
ncbi:hypothetical protein THAOC_03703, partial [Thalassiosira oceanica]